MQGRRKRRKKMKQKELDRISSLPDCLLREILSKIDTRSAAQTSVLSKRWVSLWVSLQHLDLDCRFFPNLAAFENFANQVFSLRRRDGSSVLSLKFRRPGHSGEIVDAMIGFAALSSVRCLQLRWIKLWETDMVVPSLPSVTSLLLSDVRFDAKSGNYNFFSCFPNLEDLSLLDSDALLSKEGVLQISLPRLAKFTSRNTSFTVCCGPFNCKVVVSSPSLTHFCIEGRVPIPLLVKARGPLEEAEVDFGTGGGEVEEAWLMNLMQGLYSAKSLHLSVGVVEALSNIVLHSQGQRPSPFRNLKSLKLKEFPDWERFEVTDLVRDYLLGGSPLAKASILR